LYYPFYINSKIIPAPIVILPSLIINLKPIFNGILLTNFILTAKESPGITALISSGNIIEPVTLAVLKKN